MGGWKQPMEQGNCVRERVKCGRVGTKVKVVRDVVQKPHLFGIRFDDGSEVDKQASQVCREESVVSGDQVPTKKQE